ncbi:branched-chain amino acid transport system substrate-binding protein [Oxalobacteraceae bacterium GrIS 1.11]
MSKYLFRLLACLSLSLAASLVHATPGVTAKTILIGQSAALTGPAQQLGTEMRDGAQAYFDYVNSQGGVAGRQIVLKSMDDGYEPERAAKNTKALIDKEGVFSLFGYVGTPTSNAAMPLVASDDIPFFAPLTGAQTLREPFNKNIFNIRAGYYAEMEQIVENLVSMNATRVAVFYQNDAYGKAGLEGVTRALKRRKIDVFAVATVERNSVDVTAAVAAMKKAQPRAVIMVSTYMSSAAFIRAMQDGGGSVPYFWNISFVGSQALSKELGKAGRGVMISQVVPAPWNETLPVVKEYRRLYAAKPGRQVGFVSMEGFMAAKVFVEGLRRAGSNLTRASFSRALESMAPYDLGGFVVKFSDSNHNGSDFVDLTVISAGGSFIY